MMQAWGIEKLGSYEQDACLVIAVSYLSDFMTFSVAPACGYESCGETDILRSYHIVGG
jgi:hypothetical protein